jgi:oxygen-independent coproporphyrinogen-3 oxidase
LSCYEVIYEEDTALFAQLRACEFEVDEDLACEMYEELVEQTVRVGFQQYEIANFARDREPAPSPCDQALEPGAQSDPLPLLPLPSRACRHNVNYWRGGDFYGLGPSATSYIRGVRTKNVSNTELYCRTLEQGRRAFASGETLPPLARAGETAAFGLRMVAGWPFEQFRRRTGHDLRQEWAVELQELVERGWGHLQPDRFRLTREGLRFADAAAELFLR